MLKQSSETYEPHPSGRMSDTTAYSAHTILHAVAQGWTEEQWKQEQHRTVSMLSQQPTDKASSYADAANRYEQTIAYFKDLVLWPW